MKTVTYDEAQWQLVPKEPTDEMLIAGTYKIAVGASYKAMLASAPPAPDVENRNPQASVVQQEPVAWMVMNGACRYQLCGSEKSAIHLRDEMQKRHDLSGSLAAFHVRPLVYGDTNPAHQAKPQPLSDPLHDDIQSVLFEVEEAIKNGCCPWQIEAAFEAYEAARRLQQPAHGIQGS